jgi:hypothetical protein
MINQLHPIWFSLPKRFYSKVELSAESAGLKPEDALELAIDIFGRFVITAQRNTIDTKQLVARVWPVLRALQKDADANEVNLMQALEDAAKLYHMYGPLAAKVPPHGGAPERKSPSALAILRWANIPQAERSKRARELALKRWGSKKKRKPKAVGQRSER